MPYAIQSAFILLAPILFAASIYMTLSRVIRSVSGEKHAIVRPLWLTRIFVTGDIIALTIQSGASGMMVVSDLASFGEGIVIGGLAFHIIIFWCFWASALLFHLGMRKDPVAKLIPENLKWQELLYMLYGSSALIMGRSIFRMIEFIMGYDGYLLSTEWPLYVFDAVPMLLVMVIFCWWFPSVVQQPDANNAWRTTGESLVALDSISRGVGQVKDVPK